MPIWEELPIKEKYSRMARQGHGFVTGLPIRIVKPDEKGGVLIDVNKDGKEIGEIIFFGNICAKEYLKDGEATRKLFAGGGLHSGDLAVWHEDGSAQILDRAKDIIISGSYFFHPSCNFLAWMQSANTCSILQVVRISRQSPSRQCSYSILQS